MSLKSLFSSLPLNTLPLLLCSPSFALSFSVSLLLSPCSPSQPEPENKRDQTQVPSSSLLTSLVQRWDHLTSVLHQSHLTLSSTRPFSASAWKNDVDCNDVLPTFCFSSFSASASHSPASRLDLLLFWTSPEGHNRRSFSQSLFYTSHLNH